MRLPWHVLNEPGNGSAAFLYELTRLPLHNIQRIEVLRGPGSPVFGANAFLGAVNIITPSAEQIGGTELTLRGEFDAGGRVGQELNLLSGGRLSEDWEASLNVNIVERPGETIGVAADAAGRGGEVDNDVGQFDAQVRVESRNTRVTGRFTRQARGEHYGAHYQLAPDDETRFSGGYLELQDQRGLGDALDLKTRIYADLYDGEAYSSFIPRGSQAPDSPWYSLNPTGGYAILRQKLAKYGLNVQLAWGGWADHRSTLGLMLEYQSQFDISTLANFLGYAGPFDPLVELDDDTRFSRDAHRVVSALFIEDLWKITPDLNLNLGVRLDHYSNAGLTLNPRVGINWQLNPAYQLRALWGTAFREPDFRSMYLNAGTFFGNPALEEERVNSFELGSNIRFRPNLSLDLTLFHNSMNDLILLSQETSRFENIGRLSTRGMELEAIYEFGSGGRLGVAYGFVDSYGGIQAAGFMAPRHSGSITLGGPLHGGFEAGLQLYWQSRAIAADQGGREPLDAYALVNARLGYRWTRHFSLEMALYNLLGQDYAYPAPAGTYRGGLPAAGRSAMLGLQLEI